MIRREDVADLQVGDVVQITWPTGVVLRGPIDVDPDGDVRCGPMIVRHSSGRPTIMNGHADLAVISRAPRPFYVNHDRAEPVPGDVVRVADDDGDRRTWMRRGETSGPEWIRVVDGPDVRTRSTLIDAHDCHQHLPARLRLLVDGTTGQVVP